MIMHKPIPVAILFTILALPSCFIQEQAIYLSPKHAAGNNYKTIPLVVDSLQAATYVSGMIHAGGANHRLRDGNLGFQGNIHQSRQWGHLQTFYGAGMSVGVYDIRPYTFAGNQVDASWINRRAGSQFFGSYGLQGGLNFVQPFSSGAEWRILGIEGSIEQEFGSYYTFRKDLPSHAANVVERSNRYASFTVSSDVIGRFFDGSTMGYKVAYTQSFRRLSGMVEHFNPVSTFPKCLSHTIHITVNKWTGYGQANFGMDATNVQFGMIRRLSATRKN
jgi:hypothetical protein